jgi:hypothetical protein
MQSAAPSTTSTDIPHRIIACVLHPAASREFIVDHTAPALIA